MSWPAGSLICGLFGHLDAGVLKESGCDRCGYPATAFCRLC